MSNKTKIIIGILIVAAIVVGIVGIINQNKPKDEKPDNNENIINVFDYVDEEDNDISIENTIDENSVEQNTTAENNINNTTTQNNTTQTTVIGKEEQESSKENTETNDKQQAIDLAKQEWGISVDSYDFRAELKSDKIYEVSVINKTNTHVITKYTVNLKTGTVTE